MKSSKKYPNGSKWLQNSGDCLEIVEFLSNSDFMVKFENSPVFKAQAKEIRGGVVANRANVSILGVGILGFGKYKSKVGNAHSKSYQAWIDMLRRCYDEKRPFYFRYGGSGVTVCEEWKTYQNFAEWYENNYIEDYAMDKDLIDYKSKTYSPETCTFIPTKVNSLFTGGFKTIVPKKGEGYIVQLQKGEKCSNGNKRQSYFGKYACREQALDVYFTEKMKHINEVVKDCLDSINHLVLDNILNREWVEEYVHYLSDQTNRRNK